MKVKPMNFVVCLKQVPAVSELEWDAKTGGLKRDRAGGMMDLASRHALETALALKELHGGKITAVTMGPPQAEETLREALVLGAEARGAHLRPGHGGGPTPWPPPWSWPRPLTWSGPIST